MEGLLAIPLFFGLILLISYLQHRHKNKCPEGGQHDYRYTSDHEWCMMSIAGCEHYKCSKCKHHIHRGYPDHPHTHKYPAEGAKMR